MTSLRPGHEQEFLKKMYKKMKAEYMKARINIDNLDHPPSPKELEEIKHFNLICWKELGGDGTPPEE